MICYLICAKIYLNGISKYRGTLAKYSRTNGPNNFRCVVNLSDNGN